MLSAASWVMSPLARDDPCLRGDPPAVGAYGQLGASRLVIVEMSILKRLGSGLKVRPERSPGVNRVT